MKKMLNYKGMTIIEIILAIGLVSIVMVQVLNLLVDLKSEQVLGESKTNDLSNRSLIMQKVENDFLSKTITSINDCPSLSNKIADRDVYSMKSCVKLVYDGKNSKPYFLITARNTINGNDYFIYGDGKKSSATTPEVYEAWKLESGKYPGNGSASACQFQILSYDCKGAGNVDVCNSRYFVLKYPVILSKNTSKTIMNFDLEFAYYFRNTVTAPSGFYNHTGFWSKHTTSCRT